MWCLRRTGRRRVAAAALRRVLVALAAAVTRTALPARRRPRSRHGSARRRALEAPRAAPFCGLLPALVLHVFDLPNLERVLVLLIRPAADAQPLLHLFALVLAPARQRRPDQSHLRAANLHDAGRRLRRAAAVCISSAARFPAARRHQPRQQVGAVAARAGTVTGNQRAAAFLVLVPKRRDSRGTATHALAAPLAAALDAVGGAAALQPLEHDVAVNAVELPHTPDDVVGREWRAAVYGLQRPLHVSRQALARRDAHLLARVVRDKAPWHVVRMGLQLHGGFCHRLPLRADTFRLGLCAAPRQQRVPNP
mmetsp:Transcript_39391/g.117166  ORF Transcript_39391/g.117166 Transcript_39391/m.117166 type:complete len:309 (-) Transcript_39391:210-1136(-)